MLNLLRCQRQKSVAHFSTIFERTGKARGESGDTRLVDTSGAHALMFGFNHDGNASGPDAVGDGVGDLAGHGFLGL